MLIICGESTVKFSRLPEDWTGRSQTEFYCFPVYFVVVTQQYFYLAGKHVLIKVPKQDVYEEKSNRLQDMQVESIDYKLQIVGLHTVGDNNIAVIHSSQ